MKIAHLTSAHPAEDVRILHKEAATLAGAGHEVILIAVAPQDNVIKGVRIRALTHGGGRRQRWLGTVPAVLRAALAERADVHHFHDPELIPVGLCLKLMGKRVIYDVHEDVPRQILSKPWIRPSLRRGIAVGAALAERLGARLFDAIVAATPAIGKRFPSNKTVTVQNFPIRGELCVTTATPYRDRTRSLAYVGGITSIRGAREMVAAMAMLPDSSAARLVLAGKFTEPALEASCRAGSGWARVDYRGWQSRSQVADLLGEARGGLVLFHPEPNHMEAQPNKLFEYMSAGLPVVASDFPLWRRIVDGVGCGLLVDPRDPRAISEALLWLLEHPAEAEAMGHRGREAVLGTYNWDAEARKLLHLYQRMLP